MSRIVYIYGGEIPSVSASSVHVVKICAAFKAIGFEIGLLYPWGNESDIDSKYNVRRGVNFKCFKMKKGRFTGLKFLLNCIRSSEYSSADIVITRDFLAILGCLITFKKCIFEMHHLSLKNELLFKFVIFLLIKFNLLKKIIVITKALKKDLMEIYGIDGSLISVLYDGADLPGEVKPINLAGKYERNVGYCGSLKPGKGVDTIVKISRKMPEVGFHIVGGTEEEISSIKKSGINNLIFYGFQNQKKVAQFINAFDICLLPNKPNVYGYQEAGKPVDFGKYTSPLKLFEYLSHGKKIICSDLPVLREPVGDQHVYFSDYDNIPMWVNSINSAFNDDDNKAVEGYLLLKEHYTWSARALVISKFF